MCKCQFYVYSSLRHLLLNGIIFCNISWYLACIIYHTWCPHSCMTTQKVPYQAPLCPKILAGALYKSYIYFESKVVDPLTHLKQEAHGPRFAHLSDIATADMQMLCNIFPILSLQLMKIPSFEQFLGLKKNIRAWQSMEHDYLNKLSITFQQKHQCEIWWKLAKWFLKNHDFIHVNSTVAGKYYKYKPDDGHLRFPIRTILTTVDLQVTDTFNINVYGPHK